MIESAPGEFAPSALHVELQQVCVVDGAWQDVPDNIAVFEDARLIADATPEELSAARTRGNLYVVLDVSGEIEGRSDVERELIETIRREYSRRRGSITFGLSEALRAANVSLFDLNLQAPREARRMAGISAVVLRGEDLYIAQAGPAVVFVEVNGRLHRYPAESDWFTEDAPLISPQGNASAPLGVRREFTCDLFHTTIAAGDVFVLASRGLTQLTGTEELAHAIENHGAEDIASFLEDTANGADLTALVAELVDPRDLPNERRNAESGQAGLNASAGEPDELEGEPELEHAPEPAFAAQAVSLPAAAESGDAPAEPVETTEPVQVAEERLARQREERRLRRQQQIGAIGHALGGIGAVLVGILASILRALRNVVALVDWQSLGDSLNRGLNKLFLAAWNLMALTVRLMLPGTPTTKGIVPRRDPREAVWLKGLAVILPLLMIALAAAPWYQQLSSHESRSVTLLEQAQTVLQHAIILRDTDKAGAQRELSQAQELVDQARAIAPSREADQIAARITDTQNEMNGVMVLRGLTKIAQPSGIGMDLSQLIADDTDIYFLDRLGQRIFHYRTNDSGTHSDPASGDGILLQTGISVDNNPVDRLTDIAWTDASSNLTRGGLVTVSGSAILEYDPTTTTWHSFAVTDSKQWGDIRSIASYMGNIYLLDAGKNQIWKYVQAGNGFAGAAVPYLPANSPVDLTHAVDMAIDGDLWVLTDAGKVLRLRSGQRLAFDLTGLETPLNIPIALYARTGVDNLYIVDTGNRRIVEFDKTGRYLHQYKPESANADSFSQLKTLFVSQSKHKFYFISANQVYQADIQ